MRHKDYKAARLLSGRNEPSVLEEDDILDQVLERTARQPRERGARWLLQRWRVVLVALAALSAVPAVMFWVVLPLRPGEFSARSGTTISGPSFSPVCEEDTCRQGRELLFRLERVKGYRFFSALSRGEDGTVAWFFPGGSSPQSLSLAQDTVEGVTTTAVVLGPEHPPGRHHVYGVFSREPLSKGDLRALLDAPENRIPSDAFVVRRALVVVR